MSLELLFRGKLMKRKQTIRCKTAKKKEEEEEEDGEWHAQHQLTF